MGIHFLTMSQGQQSHFFYNINLQTPVDTDSSAAATWSGRTFVSSARLVLLPCRSYRRLGKAMQIFFCYHFLPILILFSIFFLCETFRNVHSGGFCHKWVNLHFELLLYCQIHDKQTYCFIRESFNDWCSIMQWFSDSHGTCGLSCILNARRFSAAMVVTSLVPWLDSNSWDTRSTTNPKQPVWEIQTDPLEQIQRLTRLSWVKEITDRGLGQRNMSWNTPEIFASTRF